MAGEAILILESNPAEEARLNSGLSGAGYHVYAADSATAILSALKATRFPTVIVDADAVPSAESFGNQVRSIQPDTDVIFSVATQDARTLMEIVRGGGREILPKPFELVTVLRRVTDVIERRRHRVARLAEWEVRTRNAEAELARTRAGNTEAANSLHQVADFADFALNTFLTLARENQTLGRSVRHLSNPGVEEPTRILTAWIAHSDPEFSTGVASLGPRIGLEIPTPMSTGGEVLDRISTSVPDIMILDTNLPDIPGQLVLQTLRSEHPDVEIVVVDGWGTNQRHVSLAASEGSGVERPMKTVQDLLDVLEIGVERARDTALGRDFAHEFKARHDEFLRRYAAIKRIAPGN